MTETTHWHRGYADDTPYSACIRLWKCGQCLEFQLFLLTFNMISALEHFVF